MPELAGDFVDIAVFAAHAIVATTKTMSAPIPTVRHRNIAPSGGDNDAL